MRPLIAILGLATLACQPGPLQPAGNADSLARALAGRTAIGQAQACIPTQTNQNLIVIDAATVGYEVGSTLWVNRLPQSCPGLSPYNMTMIEADGSQICRGDRVRGLEPGATIPGPGCNLQSWSPYRWR